MVSLMNLLARLCALWDMIGAGMPSRWVVQETIDATMGGGIRTVSSREASRGKAVQNLRMGEPDQGLRVLSIAIRYAAFRGWVSAAVTCGIERRLPCELQRFEYRVVKNRCLRTKRIKVA